MRRRTASRTRNHLRVVWNGDGPVRRAGLFDTLAHRPTYSLTSLGGLMTFRACLTAGLALVMLDLATEPSSAQRESPRTGDAAAAGPAAVPQPAAGGRGSVALADGPGRDQVQATCSRCHG